MKKGSAAGPCTPTRNSGKPAPSDETKNSTPAISRPVRRPQRVEIGPAMAAPITQPSSAQPMAKPERKFAVASGRCRGVTKL